jgi:hypothetical protein
MTVIRTLTGLDLPSHYRSIYSNYEGVASVFQDSDGSDIVCLWLAVADHAVKMYARLFNKKIGVNMRKFVWSCRWGIRLAGIICCGLMAQGAAAQTMNPGLWEITSKIGGSGEMGAKMAAAQAKMQEQLASMPPAQRKQMEQMFAQRGISFGAGAGTSITARTCITKEMAARNQPPAQQQGNCKQEYSQRSGNTTRFKFVCTDPPSSGVGEVTLLSADSYVMKMTTTSLVKGKPQQMSMDARAKWLTKDCGNIRPAKG